MWHTYGSLDFFLSAAQNSPELNIRFIDSFYPMICGTISGAIRCDNKAKLR